jgi:hypothetical protein
VGLTARLEGDRGRRAQKKVRAYQDLDPMELVEHGKLILSEDNEWRASAGLDVHEQPMPVTLREQGIGGKWVTIKGRRILIEPDPNPPAGKPLDPHGHASRIVTLAETRHEVRRNGTFVEYAAQLGWPDFTNANGDWILGFHSHPDAKAPYPKRDMTSRASDTAVKLWREACQKWIQEATRVQP